MICLALAAVVKCKTLEITGEFINVHCNNNNFLKNFWVSFELTKKIGLDEGGQLFPI